jgi:hypothetical protein
MEIRSVNEFHPAPASLASEPESTHVIPDEALAARSPPPKRLLPESLWMERSPARIEECAAPSRTILLTSGGAVGGEDYSRFFRIPAVFPISMAGWLLISSISKINFGGEPWIADRFSAQA